MEFQMVKVKTKVSQLVLENIKDAIMDGSLKPGDRLPAMPDLASQMGVGISSVREAIKMLEALDILKSIQGEGTYVNDEIVGGTFNALSLQLILVPQSQEKLVEFRRVYETAYTHLAMSNATQEDLDIVEKIVRAQEEKDEASGADSQDERDYHLAVLNCTHNIYIIRLGEIMLDIFQHTLPVSAEIAASFKAGNDHRHILESIKNKDIESLDRVLEKSFSGWEQQLRNTTKTPIDIP
jgi:GntR family transcriptional repressor for pyruvate dehydrogenase complex